MINAEFTKSFTYVVTPAHMSEDQSEADNLKVAEHYAQELREAFESAGYDATVEVGAERFAGRSWVSDDNMHQDDEQEVQHIAERVFDGVWDRVIGLSCQSSSLFASYTDDDGNQVDLDGDDLAEIAGDVTNYTGAAIDVRDEAGFLVGWVSGPDDWRAA